MELNELKVKFKEEIDKIEKAWASYKRLAIAKRTPSLKKKRVEEATEIWQSLSRLTTAIELWLDDENPDPCYHAEKSNVTKIYKDYIAVLVKEQLNPINNSPFIKNIENEQDSEDNENDDDNEGLLTNNENEEEDHEMNKHIQTFLKQQTIRYDTIKRMIRDVQDKQSINQKVTVAYCNMKIKRINESWQRMQVADEECVLDRDEFPGEYHDTMKNFEDEIEEVLLFLQEGLEKPNASTINDAVKLPRVTIPKFSGDYFKWTSFRDLFSTMVVDNKALSDGQRMQLLKSYVDGEAENLIRDLTIADVNFTSAWERITGRYNNKRVVVYKHLTKLMNQKMIQTESKSVKKLLDITDQTILALKNLERPVENWDDWIIIVITQKLSDEVRKDWEKKIGISSELPTWEQLKEFLEEEFRMLEGVENGNKNRSQGSKASENQKSNGSIKVYQSSIDKHKYPCPACAEEHGLFQCAKFKSMNVTERFELAKANKLCFKCLKKHKDVLRCDRKKPCKKCDKGHSTWLHESKKEEITNAVGIVTTQNVTTAVASIAQNEKQVLLATALITTNDLHGRRIVLRALIDQGSQGSMITDKAASLLQLEQISTSNYITGLTGSTSKRIKQINLVIRPRFQSEIKVNIECYILKKLTKMLPDSDLNVEKWNHLKGLQLADPTYNKMGQIDILLGNEVVNEILEAGFIKGEKGSPMAQETTFGWIVSGKIDPTYPNKQIKCLVSTTADSDVDISKFWELEELNPKRTLTPDERECEEFYKRTHSRDERGIFTVKIPFKNGQFGPSNIGQSRGQAMARFLQLEKRFMRDVALKQEYTQVMTEYISMGHMTLVDGLATEKLYYIPHHAVIKPDSLTTKTRVVFDASAKTSTGVSLNDTMYTGAKQQNDLLEILVKWRKHKVVFKADIAKMYRMIGLDKNDQRYHTVLWRENPDESIKEYQLTTATFGTAAAPFMATRSLNQLAEDGQQKYPMATDIIKNDFYVDDLISGSDNVTTALQIKDDVINALKAGGMKLRKWTSNSPELLESLPEELTEKSLQSFGDDDTTKALGLQWNPRTDKFSFKITKVPEGAKLTKRSLFSEASKIFDPLGWLAPVVINPKLIMQEIWNLKLDWDDELPSSIKERWNQFRNELPSLSKISIDRWIQYDQESEIQLHGFCDASEKAYAAAVYTRITKGDKVEIRLVASKTRVASIKTKITLPRLELCGAVLLSNLLKATKEALQVGEVKMTAWSDSLVALGWLKGSPNKWNTFVANRVSEVHSTQIEDWRYVPSEENPADCPSRGLMPGELETHPLWWTGPGWLKKDESYWPNIEVQPTECEQRKIAVHVAVLERTELLLEASSWFKMVRILAYVLRMKGKKASGKILTVEELNHAKNVIIKKCQRESFPEEIEQLENNEPISSKSKLLTLNPFIDADGILRVGGRLQNAIISYDNKHPIILPDGHQISKMIIHQMHLDTLHGGPQVMIGLLRKKYWIVQGKRMANNEFKKCVSCRRMCGQTNHQIMGNLPRDRVTLERSFLHVGVDYAGPIEIRASRLKNAKVVKAYIAVFVCFGTKAIHLELVSDMTTPAFMASLQRFIARRGLCETIYSDNGRNFVGTMNQLELQEKQWLHQKNEELASLVVNKGIKWKFIPPGSPNFGGLWERGVRSVKDHLKRTLKNSRLTFEEYNTVLCQIEACLNSRPLCPLTNNVENLNALTPGHFLIGDSLMAVPQTSLVDNRANQVDRWKHLQLLQQHFWNRWHNEYLSQLQARYKWKREQVPANLGDLVLVKDEQLPPRHWVMGRIMEVHPGNDGTIRVVSLKTQKGEIKRPIGKICPLLTNDELVNGETEEITNSTKETEEAENNKADKEQGETETSENELVDHEVEKHDLGPDVKEHVLDEPIEKEKVTTSGSHHKYGLRSKVSNSGLVLLAILGLIIMSGGGSATELFKINQFKHNAGIYFEDMGKANIIRTEWHMLVRVDIARYMAEFNQVQQITSKMTNLCTSITSTSTKGQCGDLVDILSHKMEKIKELNELLMIHGHQEMVSEQVPFSRKQRAAPLNVVGWIQHEVFGVMAAEQAEKIESDFKQAKVNSKHLLNLIKNQTSIVESTVNLMKITQEESTRNFRKLEKAINEVANIKTYVQWRLKIMSLSLLTLAMVNRLENTQNDLLDVITDLHQGHVSSQFFTPTQFQQQLEIINNNLPTGSSVPKLGKHDIKSLYKIIKGNARVTKDSIIVDMVFPLVSSTDFQVLHIVPIPTEYQGQQITIIPDTEYMIITLKRDNFYQISENDFHTCMQPKAKVFICSLNHPLFNIQSTKGRCERDLLIQATKINQNCKFQVTTKKNFWINLHNKNQWIFGVNDKLSMNMICEGTTQAITIQGSGILEMAAGCEINYSEMTLVAESVKGSNGDFNFYPSLNLSESVTKSHSQNFTLVNLTIDHIEEFNAIKEKISELKAQSHLTEVNYYINHGLIWIILIVAGIIITMIWYKRIELKKFFGKCYNPAQPSDQINGVDDVEHGEVGHDQTKNHHPISSDDSKENEIYSTVTRHRGGECPFRT